jgi:hypothetical protein
LNVKEFIGGTPPHTFLPAAKEGGNVLKVKSLASPKANTRLLNFQHSDNEERESGRNR